MIIYGKNTEGNMARHKVISQKRKQKKKPDLLTDIRQLAELGLHIAVTVYLLLMIAVLPFYFTDGYAQIGTDKYNFFYKGTWMVGILFLLFWVLYLAMKAAILNREGSIKEELKRLPEKLSLTDWFVLAYGVAVTLSYIFSDYKAGTDFGNPFVGVNHWNMGLRTQLLLVIIYFAVSRFWQKNKWVPALWIPVSFVVFMLGYLNRFEVRPFEMKNTTIEYISTIGNMNWYCGYLVIIFFGGVYYLWSMAEKDARINAVLAVWMTVGFGTLVTQGSRSGLVTLGIMLIVLYLLSIKKDEKLLLFFACCMSLGFACLVTCCIRSFLPERFNYPDGMTDLLTFSKLPFIFLGITSAVCLFLGALQKKEKFPVRVFTISGYAVCAISGLAAIAFVVLGVVNTAYPGSLGSLSEMPALTFNMEWGSYRGATWAAGLQCFADQDLTGKLFGVGPDSMALYLHNGADEELSALLKECFGLKTLTNAHCEWLTVLVNNGLVGLIAYAGIYITAVFRFLKAGEKKPLTGACGFAVLAYTVNSMFSFQQPMSAVTVFIILAMGEDRG